MNIIEPVLFLDLQAAVPRKYCNLCGGECYVPSLRCERRLP